MHAHDWHLKEEPGQTVVETLGGQDLNLDGSVINLAIVGSSRFYDFEVFESALEEWISENTYPDLIIVGGASGVDSWRKVGGQPDSNLLRGLG